MSKVSEVTMSTEGMTINLGGEYTALGEKWQEIKDELTKDAETYGARRAELVQELTELDAKLAKSHWRLFRSIWLVRKLIRTRADGWKLLKLVAKNQEEVRKQLKIPMPKVKARNGVGVLLAQVRKL